MENMGMGTPSVTASKKTTNKTRQSAHAQRIPFVGTKSGANEVLAGVLMALETAQRSSQAQVPQPIGVVLGARQHHGTSAIDVHRSDLQGTKQEVPQSQTRDNNGVRHLLAREHAGW